LKTVEAREEAVGKALQEMEVKRRRSLVAFCLNLAVYALALIGAFTSPKAALAVAGVNLALYLLIVRRLRRDYRVSAGREMVRFGLWSDLDDARWSEPVTAGDLTALELLPRPVGDVLCKWPFRGERGRREVTCAEITLHYESETAKGKRDFRFLSGTLLTAQPGGGGEYLLLHRALLDPAVRDEMLSAGGWTPRELPKGDWGDYGLWGRGEPTELSRTALEALDRLQAQGSLGALRLGEKGLALFLPNRFYFPDETSSRAPLTREALDKCQLPQLTAFLDLAQALEDR